MRRGIMAAAAIAVARPLWLSLIVDRTISVDRGRPMRTRTVFSLVLSLLLFAGGEAFAAERRVALVIGNSSYIHAPALDNPVNDVTAVSVMLEGAGFQVVETRNNLDNTAMRRVIREFSAMTRDADVAVVFYAGHGLEVDGTNYLIPTDAKLASDIDVEDEAISLDRVLRVLEPARSLRLVILDACRDNPFVKTMKRTLASRSFGRGLAGVEPAMSNTLIAFAAKAGSTANDGDGAHSPFTTALLKHLTAPGLDLRIAFGKVRDEVLASTAPGRSRTCMDRLAAPPLHSSLPGRSPVLLRPRRLPAATSAGRGATTSSPCRSAPGRRWDAFLAAHPTGFFADLARAQRAKLLAAPAAAPAVAPVPAVLTPSRPEPQTRGKPSASRRVDSPPARAKPKPAKETASAAANRSRSSSSSGCSYVRRAVTAGTAAGLDNGVGLIAFGRRSCGG